MIKTPDLILKRGTIIDGTGRPGFEGDVAIRRNWILAVDAPGTLQGAPEELDCDGMVIAPGFIDTHSHSDLRVLTQPELAMKVRQGITLEVFGQDGISVAPIRSADRPQMERSLAGLLGKLDREWDWESVAEYLAAVERAKPSLDCSYLIPHGAVRLSAMGMEDRRATTSELTAMQDLIRQSMCEGALGMSTGLIYPPCCFADTAELIELCKTVAEFDGVFVAHMRSESDYLEDAVAEIIEVGKHAGVRVHISHFKVAGRENWPVIDGVLEMVRIARAEGMRLTADQYPYIAGSTMLGAILPPWAHAGGVEATLERLASAEERGRIRNAMLDRSRSEWDNFWKWSGPEGIIVSDVPSGRRPEIIGQNLAEASAMQAGDLVGEETAAEFALDLLAEERMGVGMISFSQSEDVVQTIMREPYVNVCTDGLLGGKPHPRAYGTYPRMLGRYVRELGVLTIEEAVRKMSGLAAETFRLERYGRVEQGAQANLVVFDPQRVIDRATFEDSREFPEGIEHVIVEGELMIRYGEQTGLGSGVVVRSKDQARSRF
ncbi:MAG TPA: D-aminoacylase [Blastocatellia bacterium]|nr:D-aminoacylase [Blastocatellia bacterium]